MTTEYLYMDSERRSPYKYKFGNKDIMGRELAEGCM